MNRKDYGLLVEGWRRFINESEEDMYSQEKYPEHYHLSDFLSIYFDYNLYESNKDKFSDNKDYFKFAYDVFLRYGYDPEIYTASLISKFKAKLKTLYKVLTEEEILVDDLNNAAEYKRKEEAFFGKDEEVNNEKIIAKIDDIFRKVEDKPDTVSALYNKENLKIQDHVREIGSFYEIQSVRASKPASYETDEDVEGFLYILLYVGNGQGAIVMQDDEGDHMIESSPHSFDYTQKEFARITKGPELFSKSK